MRNRLQSKTLRDLQLTYSLSPIAGCQIPPVERLPCEAGFQLSLRDYQVLLCHVKYFA
jgi:hypothetical protein